MKNFVFDRLKIHAANVFERLFQAQEAIARGNSACGVGFAIAIKPGKQKAAEDDQNRQQNCDRKLIQEQADASDRKRNVGDAPDDCDASAFFALLVVIPCIFRTFEDVFRPFVKCRGQPQTLLVVLRKRFKIFQRESAFFANAPEQHFQQLVSVQDAFIDQLDVEIVFRVRDGFDRHLLFEGKLKQVCRKCAWRRFVVCQDDFGKFRRILREIIRVLKIGHGNFLLDRVFDQVNEP